MPAMLISDGQHVSHEVEMALLCLVAAAATAASAEIVMASLFRPGTLVADVLQTAASCNVFENGIHVHGYNPLHGHAAVVGYPLPASPLHHSYRWLHTHALHSVPTSALANGNKDAFHDSAARALWRTSLNLDAWAVLFAAEARGTSDVVVWLENDGFLRDCDTMRSALHHFRASGASGASCYGHNSAAYHGVGTVCMMFARSALSAVLRHILGYHMVHPLDWILSDFSRSQWTTYDVVKHGYFGKQHRSTLDA